MGIEPFTDTLHPPAGEDQPTTRWPLGVQCDQRSPKTLRAAPREGVLRACSPSLPVPDQRFFTPRSSRLMTESRPNRPTSFQTPYLVGRFRGSRRKPTGAVAVSPKRPRAISWPVRAPRGQRGHEREPKPHRTTPCAPSAQAPTRNQSPLGWWPRMGHQPSSKPVRRVPPATPHNHQRPSLHCSAVKTWAGAHRSRVG